MSPPPPPAGKATAEDTTTTTTTTLVVRQSRWSPDPTKVLKDAEKDGKIDSLHLLGLSLTEPLLVMLTQILQQRKWKYVHIQRCHTMDMDIHPLGRALATNVSKLVLGDSRELLEAVLAQPSQYWNVTSLTIRQALRTGLTKDQCLLLGQRLASSSCNIQELSLKGTYIQAPALLAPGLAKSRRLEKLVLSDTSLSLQGLADLVVVAASPTATPTRLYYGIAATRSLLVSSCKNNNQLRILDLSHLHLQDHHAGAIGKALTITNSRLEELNLSFNDIGCDGIVQLSHYLKDIHRLRKLSLKPNPWGATNSAGGQALLQGMQQNTSIEYLDSLLFIKQAPMLRYCTTMNRAGRRILLNDDNNNNNKAIPLGLWPLLLERTGKILYGTDNETKSQVDALHYLLRNGPVLFVPR